jgi:hypothetical protein
MAVQIVSGATGDILTIDPTSKAARVSLYDAQGNRTNLGGRATYLANTGPITGATATGLKSLTYLFHPSTDTTDRYQLLRAHINIIGGVGGTQRLEVHFLTAENGTPGGTTATIAKKNIANNTAGATVRIGPTGAPTRGTILFGADQPVALSGNADYPSTNVQEAVDGEPLILRASQAEGIEIVQNVLTTITTAPVFNITWEWTEAP